MHDDTPRRHSGARHDELDAPLRYSTGSYRAPRPSLDTEPVYVDVLEALGMLGSTGTLGRRSRPAR